MSISAMKQALEALESWQKTCLDCGRGSEELGRATQPIAALRQAIAEAEKQEPVAYQATQEKSRIETVPARGGLLPHQQPKREWVGLTDEKELWEMWVESPSDVFRFARAIEAKLKEKNT